LGIDLHCNADYYHCGAQCEPSQNGPELYHSGPIKVAVVPHGSSAIGWNPAFLKFLSRYVAAIEGGLAAQIPRRAHHILPLVEPFPPPDERDQQYATHFYEHANYVDVRERHKPPWLRKKISFQIGAKYSLVQV
jgi:hypothetical protein